MYIARTERRFNDNDFNKALAIVTNFVSNLNINGFIIYISLLLYNNSYNFSILQYNGGQLR